MSSERPSHEQHREEAPSSLGVTVITVSDTRTTDTDKSGPLIESYLSGGGHRSLGRFIVPDDPELIRATILTALESSVCDVVILTGGTGLSPRDRTPEAVESVCDRILNGYGELFRMLSWEEIGAAAMLSRALAGVKDGRLIVATPGSTGAVRLAMEKLLLPEMGHIIRELRKSEGPGPKQ